MRPQVAAGASSLTFDADGHTSGHSSGETESGDVLALAGLVTEAWNLVKHVTHLNCTTIATLQQINLETGTWACWCSFWRPYMHACDCVLIVTCVLGWVDQALLLVHGASGFHVQCVTRLNHAYSVVHVTPGARSKLHAQEHPRQHQRGTGGVWCGCLTSHHSRRKTWLP